MRPPGPRTCKRYMRRGLARSLPRIAHALLERAEQGGLPELKLILQLSGLDKETEPAEPQHKPQNFMQLLLDNWRKEPVNGSATEKYTIDGVPHQPEAGLRRGT